MTTRPASQQLVATESPSEKATGAQSIERAIAILRIVAASGSAATTPNEVIETAGLSRGTVYRILQTLAREGLIEQEEQTKGYRLGPEAFIFGAIASEYHRIHTLALPALRRLADLSQDTAFLSVVRGHEFVCIRREEGAYPIRTHTLKLGDRHPLGVSSAGQAMLAAMSNQQIEAALLANTDALEAHYPNYTPEIIRDLVTEARTNGYAINPGLILPGSWGIGVAVLGPDGAPVAALNLCAIESRLTARRQKELATHLRREAQLLTEQLSRSRTAKPARWQAQRTA